MQHLSVTLARPSLTLALLLALAAPSPAQGPGSQTVRDAYDAAGRLVRASHDHGPSTRYTYDASSNVLRVVTEPADFSTAFALPPPAPKAEAGAPFAPARWAVLALPLIVCCALGGLRRVRS